MSRSYAEKYLLPDDEKCNYLLELLERTSCGMELFYINCDSKRDKNLWTTDQSFFIAP